MHSIRGQHWLEKSHRSRIRLTILHRHLRRDAQEARPSEPAAERFIVFTLISAPARKKLPECKFFYLQC